MPYDEYLPCPVCGKPRARRAKMCWSCYVARRETRPLAERFWKKVEKTDTCWLWRGGMTKQGYGQIFAGAGQRRMIYAHVVSYEMHVAPRPEGMDIDHLCDNPSCVNPQHLRPATHRENVLRGTGYYARNARKTHCPSGHLLAETAYQNVKGGRRCSICTRRANRASNQRRKDRS
jgi:hypothetical protein